MKKNKRTLLLLVLLILVAFFGLPVIKKNLGTEQKALIPDTSESSLTDQILTDIQNASLDVSVLQSPVFSYLRDFTLPLINLPIGRANPFAPIR